MLKEVNCVGMQYKGELCNTQVKEVQGPNQKSKSKSKQTASCKSRRCVGSLFDLVEFFILSYHKISAL